MLDTEAEEVIDRIARPAARVPSAGEPCVTIDLAGIGGWKCGRSATRAVRKRCGAPAKRLYRLTLPKGSPFFQVGMAGAFATA